MPAPSALPPHLSALSPADVLLRLRAAGVGGVVLLESLGPLTSAAQHSFLSAEPVATRGDLPDWPGGTDFFPAWLGGLRYEASRDFDLATRTPDRPAQQWGLYPSGLVWQRAESRLTVVGEPHLDWAALLNAVPAPAPQLEAGAFTPDDLDFPAGVRAVQELIRAGEVYQVNLSRGCGRRSRATRWPLICA